ncbi:class I SAM-dependent methyltransferase [Rhodococcus sp. NPDC003322]
MTTSAFSSALLSAAARAAHLLVDDEPHILVDSYAQPIVESQDPKPLGFHHAYPSEPVLAGARLSTVVRSAFAENRLEESGCRQYVVLGAGLDTSALRVATRLEANTFHVDTPDTLEWRRSVLEDAKVRPAGIDVPHDFASGDLLSALAAAGLDPRVPTFVSWLGVTMYLRDTVVRNVIQNLALLAAGSELVADAILPEIDRDDAGNRYAHAVSKVAGEGGEPWRTTVDRDELRTWLSRAGWRTMEVVDDHEAVPPALDARQDALQPRRLAILAHARR